jgi:peptide/nickel transport system permease protein
MSAAAPPSPVPAAPAQTQWDIVRRTFRRNRPAVWGLRVVVALVALAILAPLIACDVPLLWQAPGEGLRSPWLERLFDKITWEHAVDRFFNSLLCSVPLGLLLAGVARALGKRARWLRWYAAGAALLALLQATGIAFTRSLPYEDFARDPERRATLAAYAIDWAERELAEAREADLPGRQGVGERTPAALRDLAERIQGWARGKDEQATSDPLDAASALKRAAEHLEGARAARAQGSWFALRAPIPYAHADQRGGREEQYVGAFADRPDHLLGTDIQGRDVFARILYGTRISLTIGIVAVSIYVTIGTFLGAIAGFFGRRYDLIIMRLVEIMICVPSLFLIMMIVAMTPPDKRSIFIIMFAIGIVSWTGVTRLVRGQFLRERALDYVTAARAMGLSNARIIFRHVLPNAFAPVLVAATFGIAGAILTENTLAFIGLGDVTVPSWGRILNDGRDSGYWHLILPPSIAIFITVTALNLVGDGVRDAMDPKLRR